jgi:hypothetical protein
MLVEVAVCRPDLLGLTTEIVCGGLAEDVYAALSRAPARIRQRGSGDKRTTSQTDI